MDAKIQFNVEKELGVLSQGRSGWNKELNKVSWNGRPAKFDIREWSPGHEKMGKGVTLSDEEAEKLVALIMGELKEQK